MSRPSGQTLLLAAAIAGSFVVAGYLLVFGQGGTPAPRTAINSRLSLADIPFDGQRAYGYLNQLCDIGRRPSGSPGMEEQQKLLKDHFEKLGGKVEMQKYRVRHPQTGEPVSMANLVVRWHPERRERILLCAHYDTRPFPDRDPVNPRGTFIGANDGASGTAILMEMAHHMAELPGRLGVDFALFDGEEFVFEEGDPYFIGAEYFAREYAGTRHPYRYRYGVLLDLVGDKNLQIYPDSHSMSWSDTRPLVQQIWGTARRLGVHEFSLRGRYDIRDDHIPLHNIGGIPCCDIIDFDYPYWHTEADVPANCSALTLAKVGWVVQEWLQQAVRK
ncbi:MAG: peptidase M28 [Planctomycetota bacterium]|nr:MAG: peptidase M28 [Planctomycetota bacterium]